MNSLKTLLITAVGFAVVAASTLYAPRVVPGFSPVLQTPIMALGYQEIGLKPADPNKPADPATDEPFDYSNCEPGCPGGSECEGQCGCPAREKTDDPEGDGGAVNDEGFGNPDYNESMFGPEKTSTRFHPHGIIIV